MVSLCPCLFCASGRLLGHPSLRYLAVGDHRGVMGMSCQRLKKQVGIGVYIYIYNVVLRKWEFMFHLYAIEPIHIPLVLVSHSHPIEMPGEPWPTEVCWQPWSPRPDTLFWHYTHVFSAAFNWCFFLLTSLPFGSFGISFFLRPSLDSWHHILLTRASFFAPFSFQFFFLRPVYVKTELLSWMKCKACPKHFPLRLCNTKLAQSRHKLVPSTTFCTTQSFYTITEALQREAYTHRSFTHTQTFTQLCTQRTFTQLAEALTQKWFPTSRSGSTSPWRSNSAVICYLWNCVDQDCHCKHCTPEAAIPMQTATFDDLRAQIAMAQGRQLSLQPLSESSFEEETIRAHAIAGPTRRANQVLHIAARKHSRKNLGLVIPSFTILYKTHHLDEAIWLWCSDLRMRWCSDVLR